MRTLLKIASRNILRNVRRSTMTVLAIAVGAMAMLMFGAFWSFTILSYRTGIVENIGHLAIFRTGYIEFGSGNPAGYGIADYEHLADTIRQDPVLGPMIAIVTPTARLYGLASNPGLDTAKTFYGVGVVPSDHERMAGWNEYHVSVPDFGAMQLSDSDPTIGVIGTGMARILGLCAPLDVPNCPPETKPVVRVGMPQIDLLAAATGGAPSVVNLNVAQAQNQGVKDLDDSFVGLNLSLAQQLLFGRGEKKATSLVVQLHHTADMRVARQRLETLFKQNNLDLEVRDYSELVPQYKQTIGLFGAIFVFISVLMALIVLFTVINTMGMSVIERTNEIGTTRALGVRRAGIRREFLLEGSLLGVIGACLGVLLTAAITWLLNHAGLTWQPPGQVAPVPFRLLLGGIPALIIGTWIVLVLVATIAALIPAARAARMPVVDALRHV